MCGAEVRVRQRSSAAFDYLELESLARVAASVVRGTSLETSVVIVVW